jgi:hypothetical protein
MFFRIALLGALLFLEGCQTGKPKEPAQKKRDVLLFLDPELRPEPIFFPKCLLFPEMEVLRHGRILNTELVGSELVTPENLTFVRQHFLKRLGFENWTLLKDESGSHWFRLQLQKGAEWIELRGVQGERVVHIYLLYRPRNT